MAVINGANDTNAVYGTDLVLMVEGLDGEWQAVAHATTHSIEITRDTREISSKSTGEWKPSAYAKISWSGSCDALVSFDADIINYPSLVKMMIDRTAIKIVSALNDVTKILLTPAPADEFATPLDDERTNYPMAATKFVTGSPAYTGDAVITAISLTAGEAENATFNMSFAGAGPLVKSTIA